MPAKKVKVSPSNPIINLILGVLLLGACYALALIAIDSGSLWVYLLTILALFFGIKSLVIFTKEQFGKNDKKRKVSKA